MASPPLTRLEVLEAERRDRQRSLIPERLQAVLLLSPSLVGIAIFVYLFLTVTFTVSLSNWNTIRPNLSLRDPITATYVDLFSTPRFQADLRNTLVFTVCFIALACALGLFLAILLDREFFGRAFYRNVFLFPAALSFVVTGVVWRWMFNPETGVNLFFDIFGINAALGRLGMTPLQPGWLTDPRVLFPVNEALGVIWPGAEALQVQLGIPVALFPVALAATWQLSGFVMVTYAAGMATIPQDIREAALMDGASRWQLYRRVIIPMLWPVTVSVVVVLLHTSLKIFDLVFSMSGVGPGFATDVPAIFVFETMFKASRSNLASAAAIVMLVLVGLVIVPYLTHALRED
jgi:glucose/mannose transport system permease protein